MRVCVCACPEVEAMYLVMSCPSRPAGCRVKPLEYLVTGRKEASGRVTCRLHLALPPGVKGQGERGQAEAGRTGKGNACWLRRGELVALRGSVK